MAKTTRVKVKESDLYTGRRLVIKRGKGPEVAGEVSNGGQCGSTQFAFSGDDGEETCVAKSSIVRFG